MDNKTINLIRSYATSRRHFLKATAIAGGMTAAATLTPGTVAGFALGRAAAQEGGDLGILNYALTLEHLENVLYRTLIGSGLLSGQALEFARTFGGHEAAHVRDLTAAIQDAGGTPVQEQARYNFPTLKTQEEVIATLADVEDLGAAAYLGAAPMIKNGDYLTVAVRIHTVEAEHATGFRFLAGRDPVPFAFAEGKTMEEVIQVVGPILGMEMPGTGAGDNLKAIGIAGGLAAAAAGIALARTSKPQAAEQE